MSKTCNKCGIDKPLSKYYNGNGRLGKQSLCKGCFRSRSDNQPNLKYVRELKENTPCKDCGIKFHYAIMEFDHITGSKDFQIGHGLLKRLPRADLIKEIEKCELVCANCHRMRTWNRYNLNY